MADFMTPTNQGRIRKMCDLIPHITKSGRANKATVEDYKELFAPLIEELRALEILNDVGNVGNVGTVSGDAPDDTQYGATGNPIAEVPQEKLIAADGTRRNGDWNGRTPLWTSVAQMAEQAPLKDLRAAMVVMDRRMDDILHEIEETNPEAWSENFMPIIDPASLKAAAPEPSLDEDGRQEQEEDLWD